MGFVSSLGFVTWVGVGVGSKRVDFVIGFVMGTEGRP